MGVGMPQGLLLQQFGEHVFRAFGHVPYHVGSSLDKKDGWRDVDVRLILPDDEYAVYGDPERPQENSRWVATILAWSGFGRQLTGLPIDFQIQQRSHANETEQGPRSALYAVAEACRRSREWDVLAARAEAAEARLSAIEGALANAPSVVTGNHPDLMVCLQRIIADAVEHQMNCGTSAARDAAREAAEAEVNINALTTQETR